MLQQKDKIYGLFAGLLAAFGWGSIGLWIEKIPLPAVEIATYRFLGAGLFLTCLTLPVYRRKTLDLSKGKIIASGICGIVLSFQFIFTILAYQKLLVGEATALTNLHIFVILLAYFSLFTRHKRLFLDFGLGGLLLLLSLYLLFLQEQSASLEYFGILMGLCSSILFGLYTILVEKLFPNSPQKYLGFIFAFGTIPLIAYLIFTNGIHVATLSQNDWFFLFILLSVSTIIAHGAYLLAVKWIGAMGAGIMSYFAIIIGFSIDFFIGESISVLQWIGEALLILVLARLQYLNKKIERWKNFQSTGF